MDPAFMPVSSDVDTRTFAEWLVDYAADSQAVVHLTDREAESAEHLAYRCGLRDAALEILERYEQVW